MATNLMNEFQKCLQAENTTEVSVCLMFIIVHMAYFKNTTDSNHRDTLRNNSGADSSWSSFSFRAIEADAHRSVILTLSPKLVT